MKFLILGTVICLMGAFASTDTGISSKRDPRFFFGLRPIFNNDDKNTLRPELRQLRNEISVLRALVTALQPLIARNAARCPTAAVGARRIGDFCYTVTTTATEYRAASRACLSMGGYLAEPTLTAAGLSTFATNINTVFGNGATNVFIGLQEIVAGGDVFWYPHSGASITRADVTALFPAGLAAEASFEAATLAITGGTLTQVLQSTTPTAAFICQYNLV